MKRAVSLLDNGISAGEGLELCIVILNSKRVKDGSQDTVW